MRSACIALFTTSSFDNLLNNPLTEAVAATHAADDEPNPTPAGISDSKIISMPFYCGILFHCFLCYVKKWLHKFLWYIF